VGFSVFHSLGQVQFSHSLGVTLQTVLLFLGMEVFNLFILSLPSVLWQLLWW
jgi:membrane-anchored protein YejM (alkaline phosphatase superfamily)